MKHLSIFFIWLYWTFIKRPPAINTKNVVIDNDIDFILEKENRERQAALNARYMRRYSGKNKFVKTGGNNYGKK